MHLPAMFERTKLPDGPRVISARLPGTRSLSVAVYVLAGSRLETRDRSGVAHFMEHLTFKGTDGVPDDALVSEAIEGIGGTSNAATDRESTVYWARLPVREAERAFGVLAELISGRCCATRTSTASATSSSRRSAPTATIPGQFVFNLFDEAFFGDTPLGWEIAGDEDSVRGLADEATSVASGAPATAPRTWSSRWPATSSHDDAVDLVHDAPSARATASCPRFSDAPTRAAASGSDASSARPAQAHICLGFPALPRDHADQWTLELLNTVLGDGSSSRLFLRLREDAGLAYDVHSFQTDYADCGTLQIYAGVGARRLPAALQAILARAGPACATSPCPHGAGEGPRLRARPARAAPRGEPPPRRVAGRPGGAPRPRPDAR